MVNELEQELAEKPTALCYYQPSSPMEAHQHYSPTVENTLKQSQRREVELRNRMEGLEKQVNRNNLSNIFALHYLDAYVGLMACRKA